MCVGDKDRAPKVSILSSLAPNLKSSIEVDRGELELADFSAEGGDVKIKGDDVETKGGDVVAVEGADVETKGGDVVAVSVIVTPAVVT